MTLRPRPTPVKEGASRTVGVRALPARSHSEDSAQRRRGDAVSARRSHRATELRKSKMSAQKADRRIREQPARSRTPAAALPGGKTEISKPRCRSWFCSSWFCGSGDMKLHCEVEVISRHLPALGLRNRGKGVRAMLILCQQTPKSQQRPQAGGERGGPHPAYLLISTLKDKRGTRYELKENIDQFFTKFVEEGKATVRLKEPPVDICLSKANSSSLKDFLSAVKLAYRGYDIGAPLSNPIPVKTSEFEKFKTKMVITSKKDYPLSKNFPHSLEHLQTSYCGLVRVDMRMLCLKNLRKLDLSHNHIKKLPATIGDLIHLQELNLSDNHLESFSVALCQSTLKKSLRSLDLSKNKIKALPVQFCQLRELTDLKLDDNELIRFPFKIGQLTNLRFLSAARNKLPFLPSEFKNLFLEYLDLFGNTFEQPKVLPVIMLQTPLTLLESSARTILYNRIPYGSHIIPFHLCQDLDTAKTCVCGRFCLSCFIQGTTTMNLHSVAHTVVLVDDMGGTEAPVLSYFCSLGCYVNSCDTLK